MYCRVCKADSVSIKGHWCSRTRGNPNHGVLFLTVSAGHILLADEREDKCFCLDINATLLASWLTEALSTVVDYMCTL